MKKLIILSLLVFIGMGSMQAGNHEKAKKVKGIRHLVLIKYKEGVTGAQKARIDTLVWNMKKEIKVIKSLEWGKTMGMANETKEYDYCLNIVFKSELDMTMYEEHPAHQRLKAAVIPLVAKLIRFNYEIVK